MYNNQEIQYYLKISKKITCNDLFNISCFIIIYLNEYFEQITNIIRYLDNQGGQLKSSLSKQKLK
ncbi:unnamed protein product [Paramecium sonneborni]|uniref:Uncharacterized protein n=1 Tax=Paramecium sonneborni TaxID=65129 RepID=A0A8S1M1G2_9CILI|nr:unnamed protein product [Paramecium sonneborni]